MLFDPSPSQIAFFRDYGFVEFENLLTEQEILKISQECDRCLKRRFDESKLDSSTKISLNQTYLHGWNLQEESPFLNKFLKQHKLLRLIKELTNTRKACLAYTQLLRTFELTPSDKPNEKPFPIFSDTTSLNEVSSYQGLQIGLMIHLAFQTPLSSAPLPTTPAENPNILHPLPAKPGSVTFFAVDHPFSLAPLLLYPYQSYLMTAYGKDRLIYKHQPKDPHNHRLKQKGFGFGDSVPVEIIVL